VKIAIIVEGKTETAFTPILRKFLESRLQQMPKLVTKPQHGRIPKEDKLKRVVENLFWSKIQQISGGNRAVPSGYPELVNHNNPPSYRIKEIFEQGKRRSYDKARDAKRILEGQNLVDAAKVCPELKAFLNTILFLREGELIP